MVRRGGSVLACAALLGLAAATASPSGASELIPSQFKKYLPASVRSEIESHIRPYVGNPSDDASTRARRNSAAAAPGRTCLTKEYLATGAVLFKDICTRQWAVNSTNLEIHREAGGNCLTKEGGNGIVVFRDTCTNEWAMNTSAQAALPQ